LITKLTRRFQSLRSWILVSRAFHGKRLALLRRRSPVERSVASCARRLVSSWASLIARPSRNPSARFPACTIRGLVPVNPSATDSEARRRDRLATGEGLLSKIGIHVARWCTHVLGEGGGGELMVQGWPCSSQRFCLTLGGGSAPGSEPTVTMKQPTLNQASQQTALLV
jgi:hypothetical protein